MNEMTKYNVYTIFDNKIGNVYAPNEQEALRKAEATFIRNKIGYVEEA